MAGSDWEIPSVELSFPFPLKSPPALALAGPSVGAWSKGHQFLTTVPKLGALDLEGSQRLAEGHLCSREA